MPLINCKECGKQISSEALACPNCGLPLLGSNPPSMPASPQANPQSEKESVPLLTPQATVLKKLIFKMNPRLVGGLAVITALFLWHGLANRVHYKVVKFYFAGRTFEAMQEELNDYGRDGWRLVSSNMMGNNMDQRGDYYVFVLMR